MIWLLAYLALGAGIGLVLWVISRMRASNTPVSPLLASLRAPLTWRERFLEDVVVPALAVILMVLAWPIALGMVGAEIHQSKRIERRQQGTDFRVRKRDLLALTTPETVAAQERVHDPLGAVPDLPFGHLHAVWQTFLDARPTDAQLWSFACAWKNDLGQRYRREGYVWVSNGQPRQWMLSLNERIQHD